MDGPTSSWGARHVAPSHRCPSRVVRPRRPAGPRRRPAGGAASGTPGPRRPRQRRPRPRRCGRSRGSRSRTSRRCRGRSPTPWWSRMWPCRRATRVLLSPWRTTGGTRTAEPWGSRTPGRGTAGCTGTTSRCPASPRRPAPSRRGRGRATRWRPTTTPAGPTSRRCCSTPAATVRSRCRAAPTAGGRSARRCSCTAAARARSPTTRTGWSSTPNAAARTAVGSTSSGPRSSPTRSATRTARRRPSRGRTTRGRRGATRWR